jgi:hypothetical protein
MTSSGIEPGTFRVPQPTTIPRALSLCAHNIKYKNIHHNNKTSYDVNILNVVDG